MGKVRSDQGSRPVENQGAAWVGCAETGPEPGRYQRRNFAPENHAFKPVCTQSVLGGLAAQALQAEMVCFQDPCTKPQASLPPRCNLLSPNIESGWKPPMIPANIICSTRSALALPAFAFENVHRTSLVPPTVPPNASPNSVSLTTRGWRAARQATAHFAFDDGPRQPARY